MIPAIKAEFLKLRTTRSTYGILLFALLLTVLFGFLIGGYIADPGEALNPKLFEITISGAMLLLGIFAALTVLLLVVNEYRYNTIMYTLTSASRRTHVFLAKVIVASGFALGFTAVFSVIALLLTQLGFMAQGVDIVPQSIAYSDLVWRVLFYGWALTMFAVIFGFLIRSQVAAIAVLFLGPTTVEGLLSLWLEGNSKYLPFTALQRVLVDHGMKITEGASALLVLGYLAVGGVVAWLLFLRRDAN